MSDYKVIPRGLVTPVPRSGDFILCHRKGLASAIIRMGERMRFGSGAGWSHVAFLKNETTLIEALTKGVVETPLSVYRDTEYVLVSTHLEPGDVAQAVAFASSCIGQRYGFWTILGVALRFLTPGRGLWFGMNGTEICSGLVAQALCRGWANFSVNPAAITPAELGQYYNVPSTPSQARDSRN